MVESVAGHRLSRKIRTSQPAVVLSVAPASRPAALAALETLLDMQLSGPSPDPLNGNSGCGLQQSLCLGPLCDSDDTA